MSLQNASIFANPTSITVTGGTAFAFSTYRYNGSSLTIGNAAQTDARLRVYVDLKASMSQPLATGPNGYSQSRSQADVTFPKLLANGKYTKNAGGIYLRFDPETTAAEKLEYRNKLAQMLIDPDFAEFWDNQSTI